MSFSFIPCVFCLDAYEIGIAVCDALPGAFPSVIASSGGNDVKGAVATETELRQRSGQVGAPIDERSQAWHVSFPGSGCVMANDSEDFADIPIAPAFPSIDGGHFETGRLQYAWQPYQ